MKDIFTELLFWINFITAFLILAAIIFKPVRSLFKRFFLDPENKQDCKIDELKNEIDGLKKEIETLYHLIKLQRDCDYAMLHDRIFQSCEYFLQKGEISMNEMINLTHLFDSYTAIDGNGLCEDLMARVKNLKIKEGDC